MKKKSFLLAFLAAAICLLAALTVHADGSIILDESYIPDPTVRKAVDNMINFKWEGDTIVDTELESLTRLPINELAEGATEITTLKGLEYFPNLEELYIDDVKFTKADLSPCTALTKLQLYNTGLTEVKLSACKKLRQIEITKNPVTNIDLSGLTALDYVYITDNAQLTTLTLGSHPKLTYLSCNDNGLTSLNVTGCPALWEFWCTYNRIKTLDLSKNTLLENLYINGNQLTSVKTGKFTKLKMFQCNENKLTSLSLDAPLLETLRVPENKLKKLDLSKLPRLKELTVSTNLLSSLDLTKLLKLEKLYCRHNKLTSLDLYSSALKELHCENNKLSTLTFHKKCAGLQALEAQYNKLTRLDISKCNILCGYVPKLLRNRDEKGKYYQMYRISQDAQLTYDASADLIYDKGTIAGYGKKKKANAITAKDITRSFSLKKQTFSLNASAKGNAKLTYKSANSGKISVDKNGKVTVKAGYVGKATITITAAETDTYKKATKKITVIVNPGPVKLKAAKNSKKGKVTLKWTKTASSKATGYEVVVASGKLIGKKTIKTVKVKNARTLSKTIGKLTKGKTYYFAVRTYHADGAARYYSEWSNIKSVKVRK